MRYRRWLDVCWLMGCLALSSLWCVLAGRELGATFDEPIYVERGLERWRTGSHCSLLTLGTMPLAPDWDTLPLYVYERWTAMKIEPTRDLARVLPWARTAALVFWWLLLVYGWLAGRELAGPWGGRLAVTWLAFEPNLLAHASLATTDIPVSACLLAVAYHFHVGRERAWWLRVGLPGMWFAGALLAKASALAFGPLCMLAVEVHRLWPRRANCDLTYRQGSASRVRSSLRDFSQIAAVGFALTFIFCGCDRWAEPSFVAWSHGLSQGRLHDAMVWLSEHLRLFMNAGDGLVRQILHNLRGHNGTYILGRSYSEPVWYYFPLALATKLTLPLLAALAVVVVVRRRTALNWAVTAALVLLLFSFTCRVQIGVRMMLPLVTLLIVGLAAACVTVARDSRPRPRALALAGCVAAVLWTSVAAWRVWPDGLCYTNELWGGTAQGYLWLSDSNYDWGQGLKQLTTWTTDHDLDHLDVWYFGTDPAIHAAPFRYLPLHAFPLDKPDDVRAFAQGRYLAVSTTLAYGARLDLPGHRAAIQFVRVRQPVARTSTFLIYDLAQPEVAIAEHSTISSVGRR